MAKESGRLTALAVKNAGTGKHFDGSGLFLNVGKNGSKYWRMKYRYAGREKLLALGVSPEVSLAEARERAAKARAQLREGVDPNAAKLARAEAAKRDAGAAFPIVATAWLAKKRTEWAPETYRKAKYVIEAYLVPALRRDSIANLTTKRAADALAPIPPSLAVKARGHLGNIVRHAIREGLRDEGRLLDLRGVVPKVDKGHIPAAVDVADVRKVVAAVHGYSIPVTRAALTLAMLTAQRPGNIAAMEWSEVDLKGGEWSIPAAKMKMRQAHIVPLSKQAVKVLREMLAYTEGKRYVFPALAMQKSPHLHRDTLSKALREMGFQGTHATHGFRAMLRTVARERLGIETDVLEAQLAHSKGDDTNRAYDRAKFVAERKRLAQTWADYLDRLRDNVGKKVTPTIGMAKRAS